MDIECTVDEQPDPTEVHHVVRQLVAFNDSRAGTEDHRALAAFARTPDGIVGGAVGYTHWHWLFISHLWVDAAFRSNGLGERLVDSMEDAATRRGCTHAWLDTFGFQAKPFYESLGYAQFAELPDYADGHARHFLSKELRPARDG